MKGATIYSADQRSRPEGPVQKSHFNFADNEDVISARIKGENDTKTYHIYENGTGTIKKDGQGV